MVKGYQLELVGLPYQDFILAPPCWSRMNCALIADEVEKLIRKQAISLVTPVAGQFLSHVFTVPKKDSSQRLVVNLRPRNHFVTKCHFKMEGAGMLRDLLQRNNWLVSIDLKDAYFSIQVAEKDRKFLRFLWKEQTDEFRCLPFGTVGGNPYTEELLQLEQCAPMVARPFAPHLAVTKTPLRVTAWEQALVQQQDGEFARFVLWGIVVGGGYNWV